MEHGQSGSRRQRAGAIEVDEHASGTAVLLGIGCEPFAVARQRVQSSFAYDGDCVARFAFVDEIDLITIDVLFPAIQILAVGNEFHREQILD